MQKQTQDFLTEIVNRDPSAAGTAVLEDLYGEEVRVCFAIPSVVQERTRSCSLPKFTGSFQTCSTCLFQNSQGAGDEDDDGSEDKSPPKKKKKKK